VPGKNLQPVQTLKTWTALLLAALLLAVFGAFSSAAQAQEARPDLFGRHPANLSKIVVVGDSLSAGFQSDSLLDTAQPHGWASLVAAQADEPLIPASNCAAGNSQRPGMLSVGPHRSSSRLPAHLRGATILLFRPPTLPYLAPNSRMYSQLRRRFQSTV